MPRLRSPHGVVVNVSEEKAATLAGFTPVKEKAERKRSAKKSDDE